MKEKNEREPLSLGQSGYRKLEGGGGGVVGDMRGERGEEEENERSELSPTGHQKKEREKARKGDSMSGSK